MACIHKFFNYHEHLPNEMGLLPKWEAKTLIIGTFNPSNSYHPENTAKYFYGRKRNYFWKLLPSFANRNHIDSLNVIGQINFLKENEIALTDLLISIDDADINNTAHKQRVQTVKDTDIESFNQFTWNTPNIIDYIGNNNINAVYFTFLGNPNLNTNENTFEFQTRLIETYCRNHNIPSNRLFTPSGQGTGKGKPRVNKLINKWYNDNGASHFPFISPNFNISNFPFATD
jgi:hypothetical protein